ncbi:MAG TPA: tetratricopeptide repeat protein [Gemmataceae bacterium]|nr:tetratricopeptide repeat protein [Gemmataceae bacterium]
MKAEHRKELQTNALADRMGRMIQRMKARPSKNTVLTWILIIILGLAVVFFLLTRRGTTTTNSTRWTQFEGGHYADIATLSKLTSGYQSKAARFQLAWLALWEEGIKTIPLDAAGGLKKITLAKEAYRRLAEECKDDPILGPEALYNIAVAEEASAVREPTKHLEAARDAYKRVVEKFPDSALAKHAKQRAEELADLTDDEKGGRILRFYIELGGRREVIESLLREQFPRPELPPGHP